MSGDQYPSRGYGPRVLSKSQMEARKMTCFVGEKWEVTPFHVWSGVAWAVAVVVLGIAVVMGEERVAWSGLLLLVAAATYTICASNRATAQTQREAFELGQEHERRQRAEAGLSRLP